MFDHIEKILSLREIDAVWNLHCACMADYGFDRLIYGFTRFSRPSGFGKLDDMLILSNFSQDYLDGYIGERLFEQAPMVRIAAAQSGAFSWRMIGELMEGGTMTEGERRATEFNLRHGVYAGYSISFPNTRPSQGGIGLCARAGIRQHEVDALWAEKGREIHLLNTIFHLQVSSMPFARNVLSPRQRQVLEGVAEGRTVAETAQEMGLSAAPIEKHLRRAREALGVETTAQAVLKASMQQEIFVSPGAASPARK